MYKERGENNGYDRLRSEQGREVLPRTEPRLFLGDILRFEYENKSGYVRMVQINDYEAAKRLYRIDVDFGSRSESVTTDKRKEAGEIYEKLRKELTALD